MKEWIRAIRVHQWSKNFLIFAALIFAKKLDEAPLVIQAVLAFFSFCLLSSAVYLFNDVMDAAKDRLHPEKCRRPIASGKVPKKGALILAVVLVATSACIVLYLERPALFAMILIFYLLLNIAYTFMLKRAVVADVIIIAVGFLLRVQAGGAAIDVKISHWLILCTFFTATFLACCKRRSELALAEGAPEAREVLTHYSFQMLDILVAITASSSIMTYALYSVAEQTQEYFGSADLIYTLPVVLFGIGRYTYLVYERKAGEDPAAVILKDPGIIVAVLIWLGIALYVVYGGVAGLRAA